MLLRRRGAIASERGRLDTSISLWLGFLVVVGALLALDLGLLHRRGREIRVVEALAFSGFYFLLAMLFCAGVFHFRGAQAGYEFLAGYLIEWSLSVDNIFVFVLVFSYFAVPSKFQHRVLFYGILGALVFRAGFIAMGSVLMQYHWVILLFGLFLIFTGLKMMLTKEKQIRPEKNFLIRLFRRWVPVTTEFHGPRFFVQLNQRRHATPLLVALLFLELTDVVFAVDSVPAIFALTREPLIVFTSNIFAILGLRAMYFLLAGAVAKFHLLKYGLALVLIFVGNKMAWLNDWYGGKFPISLSLGIIGFTIALFILLSFVFPKTAKQEASA